MPALPPVANMLRCVHRFTLGEDAHAIIRFFVSYTGSTPTAGVLDTIAADMISTYNIFLQPFANQTVILSEVDLTDLTTPTSSEGVALGTTPGALTAAPLGAGTALLVNAKVDRRYRGGKPRNYWPLGDSSSLLDNQTWDSAFISPVQAALGNWRGIVEAISTGGTTLSGMKLVSYYAGVAMYPTSNPDRTKPRALLRVGGPVVDPITSYTVHPKIASQRRRNLTRA